MREKKTFDFIVDYLSEYNNEFVPKLTETVDIEEYSKKIEQLAEHFLIYNNNNEIVGFAATYINDYVTKTAYLTYIHVKKSEQGKKYGKKLLSEIIEYTKKSNFIALKLEVSKKNPTAKWFYEMNGFCVEIEKETSYIMKKEYES